MRNRSRKNKLTRRHALSARETTLLTFIAQRPNPNDDRIIICLNELNGFAKSIARVMCKMDGIYSKEAKRLATRWLDWVSKL